MAKRGRRPKNNLGDAAESFGHLLGVLTNKVEHVNQQRVAVSKEIAGFISHAQTMLNQLGHDIPKAKRQFSAAFVEAKKPGRKAGYTVSAAARRKMAIAAKKRWAAIKKAGKNALG
jgi:hypothetical protein